MLYTKYKNDTRPMVLKLLTPVAPCITKIQFLYCSFDIMFIAKHFIYWLVHQLVRCLVDHVGNFNQVTLFIYLFCSIFPSSVTLNTVIFLTSLCHSCINTVTMNRETM